MTPERWETVKRLFNEALEREPSARAAYVAEVAREDAEVADEVRALLAAQSGADEAFGGMTRTGGLKTLAPGMRLGPYEIVSMLGAGGMGEVYRARDTRLGREVAVKVLPPALLTDPDRVRRFEQEARAASALNHPNLVTVHDVGTADSALFIVSEMIEGRTLRTRLQDGPLPARELLSLASQMAAGLAKAHGAGIVHRDLKPENVMVTEDGFVKILDFGLAKLQPESFSSDALTATRSGVLMGTAGYMSPEQARGEAVDFRSDQFALGAVLYEMATGRPAFARATLADSLSAILNEVPPPLRTANAAAPAALEPVVARCLAKQAAERYASTQDLASELHALRDRQIAQHVSDSDRAVLPRRRPLIVPAVVVALIAAVAFAAVFLGRRGGRPGQQAAGFDAKFTQLTSHPGLEWSPSLSPDGKWVVYAGDAAGNWDIYLQAVGGQRTIDLTQDSPVADRQPAFSPDGERIVFQSERQGGGIFVMGRTGESVRRLTEGGYNPSWSPDGNQVVFTTKPARDDGPFGGGGELRVIDVATGEPRPIEQAPQAMQPRWSPHGHRIAYYSSFMTDRNLGQRDIWTVPATGGEAVAVTRDAPVDFNPAWSPDGSYLYFVSDRSGSMNLCRVRIDEASGRTLGEVEPLTTPSSFIAHVGFAADGTRLAYTSIVHRTNVQRVAFDPASARISGDPTSVTTGSRSWVLPQASPDGQSVAFMSFFGQEDIYVARADGTALRQLTDDRPNDRFPRWSADGSRIAFASNRTGEYQIWTMNADGSGQRQLTNAKEGLVYPVWSPDGSRMAAVRRKPQLETWLFDPNAPWSSQTPEKLSPLREGDPPFAAWSWSADGRWLAGQDESVGSANPIGPGIVVYSLASRAYTRLTDFGAYPAWLSDGRRLLFSSQSALYLVDKDTRKVRELMSAGGDNVVAPAVTADNKAIYFHRATTEADIWMAALKR
jgi:Tol biopolymer transport system component